MKAVAVVTGANRGIGLEIARRLCHELDDGSHLVLTARDHGQGEAACKELLKEIEHLGKKKRKARKDAKEKKSQGSKEDQTTGEKETEERALKEESDKEKESGEKPQGAGQPATSTDKAKEGADKSASPLAEAKENEAHAPVELHFHQLDITKDDSVEALRDWLKEKFGSVDILINNAGMAFAMADQTPFAEQAKKTLECNFFGTKRMIDTLGPILSSDNARVVNVSSTSGCLGSGYSQKRKEELLSETLTVEQLVFLMNDFIEKASTGQHKAEGWPNTAYGVSKAGVTHLTRIMARDAGENGPFFVSCCPGLCRTDMSVRKESSLSSWAMWAASYVVGHSAHTGADTPVYLALLPKEKLNELKGKFVRGRAVKSY